MSVGVTVYRPYTMLLTDGILSIRDDHKEPPEVALAQPMKREEEDKEEKQIG